jgi:hypothetical protein
MIMVKVVDASVRDRQMLGVRSRRLLEKTAEMVTLTPRTASFPVGKRGPM